MKTGWSSSWQIRDTSFARLRRSEIGLMVGMPSSFRSAPQYQNSDIAATQTTAGQDCSAVSLSNRLAILA
jgi:hypothetical protein